MTVIGIGTTSVRYENMACKIQTNSAECNESNGRIPQATDWRTGRRRRSTSAAVADQGKGEDRWDASRCGEQQRPTSQGGP